MLTLVVDAEPAQAALLEKVMQADRITVADLTEAGVLPVPDSARQPLAKVKKGNENQLGLPIS